MTDSNHQTQAERVAGSVLRPMVLADVDRVAELEVLCFKTPWPRSAIEEELVSNPRAHYFVYEVGGQIVGYCGFWLILDEGHITNLAIDPVERSKGYAQDMIAQFVKKAEALGAASLTLEVRSGNASAIHVYEKAGFVSMGVRKGYYLDSGEDALIMWKTI
ncbi:MAG: ribosomal protein S18-alanine N-acetyltransferase [Acidaminobacter sp.]|uniref:ribosomal protein S18-alanine N-acetyltransferase n=1 Tax=Acidaminobacter sp. TaxID=1872102 RepID=UPI001383FA65|nr:ribosomal protein S18-alanine N-acetyltransferase [Acidaminobacter sp.]MZQ96417.1 ribosomal protein S18-alanine N-acetyltransferase [Acidaminobacter sp.]